MYGGAESSNEAGVSLARHSMSAYELVFLGRFQGLKG